MGRLLPVRCLLCSQWAAQGLCEPCLRDTAPGHQAPHRPRCPGCGLRLAAGVARCADCERQPPPHGPVTVAVDYAPPWDEVLRRFKFGQQPQWAGALALLMQSALGPAGSPGGPCSPCGPGTANGPGGPDSPPDLRLVPVPLSPERLTRRGYNQAWEIARRLAEGLRLPARADVLWRTVDLPGQAEQDRQARLNRLAGVFQVNPARRPWLAGQAVVLVDDVLTTGATAREATRTLLAAGAREVRVWALARTPAPLEGPS